MDGYSLHIVDVSVAALVCVSALIGLLRGLVKEILSIFSWAAALFVGMYAHKPTFPFWLKTTDSETFAHILAFGTVFLGVLAICLLITSRISDRVEDGALGGLDRTLGFGFGVVRGIVIVSLSYLLFLATADDKDTAPPKWLEKARTLPLIEVSSGLLLDLLPKDLEKDISPFSEKDSKRNKDTESSAQKSHNALDKALKEREERNKEKQNSEKDKKYPASPANNEKNKTKGVDNSDINNLDKLIETIQE
jgi:membrane protein required for colicin V production